MISNYLKPQIKRTFVLGIIFILMLGIKGMAQSIPIDSLYLGQAPPDNTPKIFKFAVSSGTFAAERIAISNDGADIYYSSIRSYYPVKGSITKRYHYDGDKWTGPYIVFENYFAPALSNSGDTMFVEWQHKSYISIRSGFIWSEPHNILSKIDSAHYFQVSNSGNYYVSARSKPTIGMADWCRIEIKGKDTTAVSLGRPINHKGDNLDFFIAKDESFMIVTHPTGLGVSFPKKNGEWTNPRNLGPKINFGLGMWGTYVTSDNKYLFYTTGTKEDYSDVNIYWVRIDRLIDSLKITNLAPYLKVLIPNQKALLGKQFNFKVPDSIFFDDDSSKPLIYSAMLIDGKPLPSWLVFDSSSKTFTGTPSKLGEIKIKVIASDDKNASVACPFVLDVKTSL